MDLSKDLDTEDVMNPENNVDSENNLDKDKDRVAEEDVDIEEDVGTEEEIDTENSLGTEKDVNVENDSDTENDIDTKEEDTEKKGTDTGKKKVRKLKLLKNRVTLLHISREIKGEEKLEKMRKCMIEEDNSLTAEDLSELTSLKLISLMEDKKMISMKDCDFLKTTLEEIDLKDLKNELSEKWKNEEEEVSLGEDSDTEITEEDDGLDEMVLTQKMKDFIAYTMGEGDWRDMAKLKLSTETENKIRHDNESLYDKSYATVNELINQGIVKNWSDMKSILKSANKEIIYKFTRKFSSKEPAPENGDGENQANQEDNVSEERLRKISVGGEWKRLARNLEIKDSFIEEIDANREFRTFDDKCWQVFREYLRIHGRIGRESLNNVFVEIGKSTLKIEPPETKEEKLDESIENSG